MRRRLLVLRKVVYVEGETFGLEGDDGVHIRESMKSSGRLDSINLVLRFRMALERCWQWGCVCTACIIHG